MKKRLRAGVVIFVMGVTFINPVYAKKGGVPASPPPVETGGSDITVKDLVGIDPAAEKQNLANPGALLSDPVLTDTTAKPDMMAVSMSVTSGSSSQILPEKMINNFQFDPFSGAGSLSLPVYTPPGRNGVQPGVALAYSPRAGNGLLGVGWNIHFGAIERSTKNGVPRYDDTDTFISTLNGMMELVPVGNNEYRAKVEDAFWSFKFVSPHWEARDKQGNVYYFGLEQLLEDESIVEDAGRRFRWQLSEVRDVHGNYYFIRHFADGGFELLYTGEPGTDRDNIHAGTQNFNARVVGEVETSDRQDVTVNYKSGFAVSENRRLAALKVYAAGTLQRRYALQYEYSLFTSRSLLKSITEYGADGTALPAVTFAYQEDDGIAEYETSSVLNNPAEGDDLFNFKFAHVDEGDENTMVLYPSYNGNPDVGVFSNGRTFAWGPKYTQFSYPDDGLRYWAHAVNGGLDYHGDKDTEYYAWTYLYVPAAKTILMDVEGDVFDMFLNGDPNPYTGRFFDLPLKAGYNLLQVTGYNQNQDYALYLYTRLGSAADVMNSSQALYPQLSGDFNGDGLADVGTYSSIDGFVDVAISLGNTFLPRQRWIDPFGVNTRILLGDFNGDGRTDLAAHNQSTGAVRVALSDGTQFVDAGVWTTIGTGMSTTGDFNGDGRTDIMETFPSGTGAAAAVYYCDGSGFQKWAYPDVPVGSGTGEIYAAAEFNGDGLADILSFNKDTGTWVVRINRGGANFLALPALSGFGTGKPFTVVDFNADGISDVAYYDYATGSIYYREFTGTSFRAQKTFPKTFNLREASAQVQSSDYNGDGVTDFIVYNEVGNIETLFSVDDVPDLLALTDNGVGGTTAFGYGSSAHYDNTYLPFPIPVITSVTASNSLGDSYTTRYSYKDAYWDKTERDFYGFGEVKVLDPDDNYSLSRMLQDNAYVKGRVYEQAQFDKDHNLYSKVDNEWTVQDILPDAAPPVKFVYLNRTDNYVYDGDADGRRTAQEFVYGESPQWGQLTRAVQLGEVDFNTGADIGNDARSIETTYLNNPTGANRIIGLPKEVVVKNQSGQTVRKSWMYYDGHSGLNDLPTTGLLTKSVNWAGDAPGTVHPQTLYAYNALGGILTTTDALGHETRISYDPEYQIFPLVTRNDLGHDVVNEYYGVNGVPLSAGGLRGLWGQLKSTTDPNDQTGLRGYDEFGRAVKAVSPLDSVAYPTSETEYILGNPYTAVINRARINHGQPGTLDSAQIMDGLGRTVQAKSVSGTAGQFVVSGQVAYNSRGLPEKQYPPRFTTAPLTTVDPVDPEEPFTMTEYDAAGRVVKMTNADGTYATAAYDDWTVMAVDENGHMQKSYFDAYSRLVKKEEYTGADGRGGIPYPEEPYQLYASTVYTYDSEGNLIQTRDAHNNITTVSYDVLGRKIAMQDPDMGYWQYGYDLNGNLKWQTDAKGQRTDFEYDALNRLTNKEDNAGKIVNYDYDAAAFMNSIGRLYKAQYDLNEQTRFFYDVLGRETQSRKIVDGTEYAVARDYDALSQLKSVTYPEGMEVEYSYNAAGQVRAVSASTIGAQVPEPPQLPSAPSLLSATAADSQVTLVWNAVADADSYLIRYGTASGAYDTQINPGAVTQHTVSGLSNGTAYYFTVAALNTVGQGPASNELSATPFVPPPAPAEIVFDASSSAQADDTTSLSMNHTVTTDGNRVLVVAFSLRNFGFSDPVPEVGAVSFGGQTLTRIKKDSYGSGSYKMTSELWYVLAPQSGTHTIQANFNGVAEGITMGAVSLTGVKQQAPEAAASAAGYSRTAAVSLNTLTDGAWVVDALAEHIYSSTVTAGGNQTEFYREVNSADNFGAGSYKTVSAAGGTQMEWTFNFTRYWAHTAAVFAPADGPLARLDSAPGKDIARLVSYGTRGLKIKEASIVREAPFYFQPVLPERQTVKTNGPRGQFKRFARITRVIKEAGKAVLELFQVREAWADTVFEPLDVTTFTESDPTSRVTVTADCVSFANLETRNALSYVYAERMVEGDFIFEFDTMLTASDTFSGETAVWGLSNTEATTYDNWSGGVTVSYYVAGGVPRLELENQTNHFADNSINLTLNQRYYLTVSRSGGTVTAEIYSDPARAVLVDTMVRTDIGSGSFGFVYALSGDNNNTANNYRASGDACRFTTGAGGIPPPAGLAAPVLNSAEPGNGQVTLGWSSVSGAGGYKVKYGTSSGVYSATIDAGNVLNYTVTGLTNGTGYYFAIMAYDAQEDSPLSNEKNAVPVLPAAVELITNIQYNAAGQITRMDYANGTVVTYQYNRLNNRLVNKKTVNPVGNVLQDLSYEYDNGGNILAIHDRVHTANQTFEYDALNRLTRAQGDTYNIKTYAYDEIGNIMQKDGVYYAYGEDGAGPHAVTSLSSGARFAYDANGNMSRKVKDGITTDYLYDRENRLVEVKKNGAYAGKYEYDGDGGRTKKTVYGATIDTTVYVGSLFEMTEGRKTAHIYMGSQRIAAVMDGQLKYYFDDHLGGVNVVTDATGVKEELTEYTPFGSFARSENYSLNDQTDRYYTGQRLDIETGLYYYNARYYDPELGRFIQADTIVQAPDNPQTLNRYSYCANNPVNRIDPSGHGFFKKLWNAFKDAFGSFVGGNVGAALGGFAGSFFGPIGMGIGMYIGASFGAGVGSAIQHGGNLWQGGLNGLEQGAKALPYIGAGALGGFLIGGPAGAMLGAMAGGMTYSAQQTLENGGTWEDVAVNSLVTLGYAAASAGIQRGVIKFTQRYMNSKNYIALKSDQRPKVSPELKLKPNYDIEGKIVSYDLLPENGGPIYRQGNFANESGWPGNKIHGGEWAPEHPLTTSGFANKYGLPFENSGNPDWVIRGQLQGEYGLGPAPASYNNPINRGGAIEIRPYDPNSVKLDYFHMP